VPVRSSGTRLAQIVPYALEEQLVARSRAAAFCHRPPRRRFDAHAGGGRGSRSARGLARCTQGSRHRARSSCTPMPACCPPPKATRSHCSKPMCSPCAAAPAAHPSRHRPMIWPRALKIALGSEELIATDFSLYLTQAEWGARQKRDRGAALASWPHCACSCWPQGPLPWLVAQLPDGPSDQPAAREASRPPVPSPSAGSAGASPRAWPPACCCCTSSAQVAADHPLPSRHRET
jgi:hypothetical protein